MKLSVSDLEPFWQGSLSRTVSEDSVIPERFTPRQLAVCALSGTFSIRAGASAGVCLAFRTDADALSFSYRLSPGSTRDFYSFDLWADGELLKTVPGLMSEKPAGKLCFSLPEGAHELRLYLPNLQRTQLDGLELAGASFVRPLPVRRRLLCLGDSITQGFLGHVHSNCYASRLSRLLGAELLNQGIGAECFHVENLDEDLPFRPDFVTIAFGTNDWSSRLSNRAPEQFVPEARRYLKKAAAIFKDSRIAVITPLHRLDEDKIPEWPLSQARKQLEEAVSKIPGLCLIRGETLMPFDAALLEDHVHPNDSGFAVMAENLYAALPESWKR